MLDSMQSTNQSWNNILSSIKTRYKTEIDYIKELIDAQSKELSKRKEMADYDKSLKNKTKSIQQLEM